MPRTTLALDDDVLDLVRRGVQARNRGREVNALVVFDLPPDSPQITPEYVRRLEADEP